MPCCRLNSAVVNPASPCFRIAMICSSLCRVPFMAVLLSWVWENSHSRRSSFRGLRHQHFQIMSEQEMVLEFACGTHRNLEESSQFVVAFPANSLRQCSRRLKPRTSASDSSGHITRLVEKRYLTYIRRELEHAPCPRLSSF